MTYLVGLVVGSGMVAAYGALAYWQDAEPTSVVATAWPIAFMVLLALWILEDSKAFRSIQRPFEYGFLVFIFALPYLQYYLWRTRRMYGLLWLGSFIALYFLGYLTQLVIFAPS